MMTYKQFKAVRRTISHGETKVQREQGDALGGSENSPGALL